MKIALANNYYYLRGGCERVLFEDQQSLRGAGHDVRPFAPKDERNEPASSATFFPEIPNYSIPGGSSRVKAAVNIIYSNHARRAFAAFLDEFQPDVVHCHNIYGRLTASILDEAECRQIPVVMTVHDQKLVCPSYLGLRKGKPCQLCRDGRYWRCLRWKCHKQSSAASLVYTVESYFNQFTHKYDSVARFLCPSRFMRGALIDSGIAKGRIAYHPNALEPGDFIPEFEPGGYVLYVGRLSAEKGILGLLKALEHRYIPLRIAGEGPLEGEIRAWTAVHKMQVKMEGYCRGKHLAELYRNSAFTIVPSEWEENASMSMLESFAYGKPVLASEIGGNPELVADGEAGRLFPCGSVDALGETMREMWLNRRKLRSMAKSARRLIEERFSQQRRLSDLLAIYSNVIEEKSPQLDRATPVYSFSARLSHR